MSRLPFELALALRYLRPKGTPVSIITLICILGVMLGVAILIIVIAVMTGFGHQLRDRVLGFNAHVKVLQANGPMHDWRGVMKTVERLPGIKGVAPYVLLQVLAETQPVDGSPVALAPFVRGIDVKAEGRVSVLTNAVIAGRFDLRGESVLIGMQLARTLRLSVGDSIAIYSLKDLKKMRDSRQRGEDELRVAGHFTVNGIFDVGYYEYNSSVLVMSLPNAQDLYGLEDQAHGLTVMLDDADPENTRRVADQLVTQLGPDFEVITWMQEFGVILGAVQAEKSMMYYLLFFITIVAAFCIICAQLAFVMQKTREIGVLKSLGATRSQVVALFLAQSSVVGFTGVLAGVGTGLLAVHYRNDFLFAMRRWTGKELFPAEIYNFTELPARVVPGDLILICGVALLMCLLAGVVPAWIAASMRPVEALRNE